MSLADYACADEPAHIFAYHADALKFLRSLPDDWTHCIITDPPYGLADHKPEVVAQAITAWASGDRERVPSPKGGFMGRSWDSFVPPPAVWDECLRVLKPGGHLAVFAGSRTVDLMGLSIRLAGFEMRDGIAAWLYGSGFPKSLDVGKAIDKARDDSRDIEPVRRFLRAARDRAGLTNRQIAEAFGYTSTMAAHWIDHPTQPTLPRVEQWERLRDLLSFGPEMDDEVWRLNGRKGTWGNERADRVVGEAIERQVFGSHGNVEHAGTPVLDAAREWQGYGTALKPAHEPILLARKPLSGTVAATVLAHRTGALNIDATRVGDEIRINPPGPTNPRTAMGDGWRPDAAPTVASGRWPTNVVLAHHPECRDTGETRAATSNARADKGSGMGYHGADGQRGTWGEVGDVEQVPVFECAPGCQVAALDEQSGTSKSPKPYDYAGTTDESARVAYGRGLGYGQHAGEYGDQGGASRFFPTFRYQAKAPKAERPIVDGTGHPTVKPLGLMRWLVRLLVPGEVTYPDGSGTCGAVLDPFAGSGATLEAARLEGRRAIGVERDEHSVRLIAQRLGVDCRIPERIELTEPQEQALAHVIDGEPEADPFDELIAAVLAAPSLEELDVLRTRDGWAPEHEALAALRANDLTPEDVVA